LAYAKILSLNVLRISVELAFSISSTLISLIP
jgi:hypothetical protein